MAAFRMIFINNQAPFITAMEALFQSEDHDDVECRVADVRMVNTENTAFVSPANSLGFMDGGIDLAYSRVMFPGVEARVKARIRRLGMCTSLGRYYNRIGSAVVVPCIDQLNPDPQNPSKPQSALISAPTMFLPHDVSGTQNAYHAMMASLCAFAKYRETHPDMQTLVCPALCTGYGKMPPALAAKQMHDAYVDFVAKKIPPQVSHLEEDDAYVTASLDDEQPNHYDNREIKRIT